MSRNLVTCLPEEDLSIDSHQAPPQVPSPTEAGAIRMVQIVQAALSSRYKEDSAEECNQDTTTPHRVRQGSAILSSSRVGLQSALRRHSIPSKSATLSPSRVSLLSALRKLGTPIKSQHSPAEYKDSSANIPGSLNIRLFPGGIQNIQWSHSPVQSEKFPQESSINLPSRFRKLIPSRFWKLITCRVRTLPWLYSKVISPPGYNWVILSQLPRKDRPR